MSQWLKDFCFMNTKLLYMAQGQKVAYQQHVISFETSDSFNQHHPGVFLSGFNSSMNGLKTSHFHSWAIWKNTPFWWFDYSNGETCGDFLDGTIGTWYQVPRCTWGDCEQDRYRPWILVGSSIWGAGLLCFLPRLYLIGFVAWLGLHPHLTLPKMCYGKGWQKNKEPSYVKKADLQYHEFTLPLKCTQLHII